MFLFHHREKDKDGHKEKHTDAPTSPTSGDLSNISLHKVAKQGDVKTIQKLVKNLKKGTDVAAFLSAKDDRGMAPLHYAAESGSLETVEYLIEKGAKVNVIDKEGWSPLHIAAQEKHFSICKILLEKGCSPIIQNAEGTTAFHYIARAKVSPECRDCFAAFQAKGGDINAVNKYGETSLHQAVARLNVEMVGLLLDLGANIDALNKFGETALHKCARVGDIALPIARVLLDRGANVLLAGTNGLPSQVAVKERDVEMYKLLHEAEEKKKAALAAAGQALTNVPSLFLDQAPLPIIVHDIDLSVIASTVREDAAPSPSVMGGSSADEIKNKIDPIVEYDSKFRIEIGSKTTTLAECEPKLHTLQYNYEHLFYKHKHVNFAGHAHAGGEKVIISVLEEPQNDSHAMLLLRSSGYELSSISVHVFDEMKKDPDKAKLSFSDRVYMHLSDQFELFPLTDSHVPKQLVALERADPALTFCVSIGVILARKGQKTEREMFDNENPTEEFLQFLRLIGDKVTLSGWSGYRGGLDVQNNSHGSHSYYVDWHGIEVMYHVAQLMPYNPSDVDKLIRSGVLRNDVGLIVFQESGSSYSPQSIRSKLNHVVIVVSPVSESTTDEPKYRVAVVSRPDVAPFSPQLPYPAIFTASALKDFLLTKMIHGIRAAHKTPAFDKAFKEPRKANIEAFVERHKEKSKHGRRSSGGGSSHGGLLGALLPKRTGSTVSKDKDDAT